MEGRFFRGGEREKERLQNKGAQNDDGFKPELSLSKALSIMRRTMCSDSGNGRAVAAGTMFARRALTGDPTEAGERWTEGGLSVIRKHPQELHIS